MLPRHRLGWFWPAIGVLVCLFVIVIHQRDRIRAHWWATQLANVDDLEKRAYCLASLAAAGESATGAVQRLARHESAEVRALAVIALARLPGERGVTGLGCLMGDADRDVAESAAVSLAFHDNTAALGLLLEAAASDDRPSATAAVAALSHVASAAALEALCDAATEHSCPLVRAQAVESLAASIMAEEAKPRLPTTRPVRGSDPSPSEAGRDPTEYARDRDPIAVLVAALNDPAVFNGSLSLERQIAAAGAAVQKTAGRKAVDQPSESAMAGQRTVAQVAAKSLAMLTGKTLDGQAARSDVEQAELAAQCRRWLVERRAARSGDY